MKIELICFTDRGAQLATALAALLNEDEAAVSRSGEDGLTAADWAERHFYRADALLFVGAAGIAVRSIAPRLKSKTTDPAVVVVDEAGRYVVPILSGHLGGANALAQRLAAGIGAVAVITTATDVRGVFAVDSWAAGNGLHIDDPQRIRAVSAKALAGKGIRLYSRMPLWGTMPAGVARAGPDEDEIDVWVDISRPPQRGGTPLWLVPKAAWLGVGCRRGASREQIEALYEKVTGEAGIHPGAIAGAATIGLKSGEPGLLAFCAAQGLPLRAYGAGTLAGLRGDFTASGFVQKTTGTDNVCERSAMMPGDELTVKKQALDGVTMAVALRRTPLWFWEEA